MGWPRSGPTPEHSVDEHGRAIAAAGSVIRAARFASCARGPSLAPSPGGWTIDARYVELADSLRLRRLEFVRKIALPGALPGFIMGLRLALASAWLSLVVVEQINATSGVGYMISLARSYGQTEIILVGLGVYTVLGLLPAPRSHRDPRFQAHRETLLAALGVVVSD